MLRRQHIRLQVKPTKRVHELNACVAPLPGMALGPRTSLVARACDVETAVSARDVTTCARRSPLQWQVATGRLSILLFSVGLRSVLSCARESRLANLESSAFARTQVQPSCSLSVACLGRPMRTLTHWVTIHTGAGCSSHQQSPRRPMACRQPSAEPSS